MRVSMPRIVAAVSLCIITAASGNGIVKAQRYRNPDAPIAVRVKDLLSRMTVEEKFWQLFMLSTDLKGNVENYGAGAFGFQLSSCGDTTGSAEYVNSLCAWD